MPFNPIPSPTVKCEQALVAFLSSSLSGSGVGIYTGLDNEDKAIAPAVIVNCRNINEVVFNSRNYAFDVELKVKDIAYDTNTSDYSAVAGNVFAYFADSRSGSAAISNVSSGIRFWQIQILDYDTTHTEDAWENTLVVRMIGALVPV